MPRYYRRRYTRVVRPKKKWATNVVQIGADKAYASNKCVFYTKLCENSSQTGNPTPVVLKTGNFKLQLDASFIPGTGAGVSFTAYIVYIPEGMFPEGAANIVSYIEDTIFKHPEWILAWRYASNDFVSTTGPGNIDSIKVSSRLKRNLNSGDAVYFVGVATTSTGNTFTRQDCKGMCQFWTCAN